MIFLLLVVSAITILDIKPILKYKNQRNSIYVFIVFAVIELSYGYYYSKNSYNVSFVRFINEWLRLEE